MYHRYGLKRVFICFYFFDADHTPCCPSISVITLHCFLASDLSCYPGWTGNRCNVKEKPFPSTTTPKPEETQLGNKEAHLPPHLYYSVSAEFIDWNLINVQQQFIKGVSLRTDSVYVGIAIGLLLLVAGVAICVLALCKRRCYSAWVLIKTTPRLLFLWLEIMLLAEMMDGYSLLAPQEAWRDELRGEGWPSFWLEIRGQCTKMSD